MLNNYSKLPAPQNDSPPLRALTTQPLLCSVRIKKQKRKRRRKIDVRNNYNLSIKKLHSTHSNLPLPN